LGPDVVLKVSCYMQRERACGVGEACRSDPQAGFIRIVLELPAEAAKLPKEKALE
jgi:hypothetical protein